MFVRYTLVFLLINFISGDEIFDRLKKIVTENIELSNKYVLPVDNSDLLHTTNGNVTDFGEYDFIIIGAGSGGSALTYELSAVKKWKILLLEAGGDETEFSRIVGMQPYVLNSPMNWGYSTISQTTCCLGFKNQQCSYPRGKVMGGSSGVNDVVFARGTKADYDLWEEMGNSGWSFKDVLPIFKRQEKSNIGGDPYYHGFKGPLQTNVTDGSTVFLPVYLTANEEAGINLRDTNGKYPRASSKTVMNVIGNQRMSANTAFVQSIKDKRKNLTILKYAMVTKLLINKDNKTAYGVEFINNEKKYCAKAFKEVILSAGVFNTPQLLILSGIGPKEELKKHKIEVLEDLPVGKYYQDHILVTLSWTTNISEPVRTMDELLERYIKGLNPLTNIAMEGISFFGLQENATRPDIELLSSTPYVSIQNFMTNNKTEIEEKGNLHQYSLFVILSHPKSKGQVTLKSADIKDFPNIDVNFFTDKDNQDLETLVKGIRFVQNMAQKPAFRSINATMVYTPGLCENFEKDSKEYWFCILKYEGIPIYHGVGTTRMGKLKKDSVVNHELKVHGIKCLRIVDAGVMPEINSGHTSAPTMMIGGKAGDLIKSEWL